MRSQSSLQLGLPDREWLSHFHTSFMRASGPRRPQPNSGLGDPLEEFVSPSDVLDAFVTLLSERVKESPFAARLKSSFLCLYENRYGPPQEICLASFVRVRFGDFRASQKWREWG